MHLDPHSSYKICPTIYGPVTDHLVMLDFEVLRLAVSMKVKVPF